MKNECPKHEYASNTYQCPYCLADKESSISPACSNAELQKRAEDLEMAVIAIYANRNNDNVATRVMKSLIKKGYISNEWGI